MVELGRRRAEEAGELRFDPRSPVESAIPPEVAEVIATWLRDGGYEQAIARIAVEEPDLAIQ